MSRTNSTNFLPPDMRPEYESNAQDCRNPVLLFHVNIGSPSRKIVPFEIFEDQNNQEAVSDFAQKYNLPDAKQMKLLRIVEKNMEKFGQMSTSFSLSESPTHPDLQVVDRLSDRLAKDPKKSLEPRATREYT